MKVSYPAIFYEEKIGNYTVFFPDFQQVICGDDLADAEFMAKDCLSLSTDPLEHLIRLLNGKNRVDDVFAFFRYSPFGQGVPAHFTTEFVERIGVCVLHGLPFVFHLLFY